MDTGKICRPGAVGEPSRSRVPEMPGVPCRPGVSQGVSGASCKPGIPPGVLPSKSRSDVIKVGFYDVERTIGRGNFSVVKLAMHRVTRTKVTLNLALLFLINY